MKCALAGCDNDAQWSGKGRKSRYCSDAHKQEAYRNRERDKRNKRLREQRSRLYIIPMNLDTSNAFVTHLHRHNKAVPGAKFCVGIVDETGLLRGVAIIGRPVARLLDDGFTLEVNRCCTDGVSNGCSALYGAARKVAFALGYSRIVTYTLVDESGSSMRGAGWHKVQETKASDGWYSRPNRKSQQVYQSNKWRWESINPEHTRDKTRPSHVILPSDLLPSSDCEQLPLLQEASK